MCGDRGSILDQKGRRLQYEDQRVADGAPAFFNPIFFFLSNSSPGPWKRLCRGERRLMLAILEMRLIVSRSTWGQKKVAVDYSAPMLRSGSCQMIEVGCSRLSMCEVLGLQPDFIRQGLQDWKTKQLENTTPKPMVAEAPSRSPGRNGNVGGCIVVGKVRRIVHRNEGRRYSFVPPSLYLSPARERGEEEAPANFLSLVGEGKERGR